MYCIVCTCLEVSLDFLLYFGRFCSECLGWASKALFGEGAVWRWLELVVSKNRWSLKTEGQKAKGSGMMRFLAFPLNHEGSNNCCLGGAIFFFKKKLKILGTPVLYQALEWNFWWQEKSMRSWLQRSLLLIYLFSFASRTLKCTATKWSALFWIAPILSGTCTSAVPGAQVRAAFNTSFPLLMHFDFFHPLDICLQISSIPFPMMDTNVWIRTKMIFRLLRTGAWLLIT